MKTIKRLLLLLLLLHAGSLSAQRIVDMSAYDMAWKVNGAVLDSATQQPVANARVTIYVTTMLEMLVPANDSLLYSCVTDSAGKFAMPPILVPGGKGYCHFRFNVEKTNYVLPADRWKAKYSRDKGTVNATLWIKHGKGVRLIPKDD